MKLTVEMPGGGDTRLEAREGWTVMEAIRDAGLPITAQCGGGKACATCHVHVADAFIDRMPLEDEEERDLLESSEHYDPGCSRLACQIVVREEFDGLVVALQPDSAEA